MEKNIYYVSRYFNEFGDCLADIMGFISIHGKRYQFYGVDIKPRFDEHNLILGYILTIYYY